MMWDALYNQTLISEQVSKHIEDDLNLVRAITAYSMETILIYCKHACIHV